MASNDSLTDIARTMDTIPTTTAREIEETACTTGSIAITTTTSTPTETISTSPADTTTISTSTGQQQIEQETAIEGAQLLSPSLSTSTIITTTTNGYNFQQPERGTTTILINIVKAYPELYDKTHQLYCNNVHKGVLWQRIADELGGNATAKKAREQFSYMRKRFRNEYEAKKKGIQKALVPEPDASNYRQPLFVYEQLSFLEEVFDKEDALENAYIEAAAAATNGDIKVETELKISSDGNVKDEALMRKSSSKSSPRKRPRIQSSTTSTTPSSSSSFTEASSSSSSSQSSASSTTITSSSPISFDSILLANLLTSSFTSQMQSSILKDFSPITVPAAMETTVTAEEECAMFGRQVAIDLQRLNVHTRIKVRQRITKILMDLYIKQCESQGNQ